MSIILNVLFIINKLILQIHFKLPKYGNHKDHTSAVFHYNANNVTYDAISYARIQATNAYLKSIGQLVVDGKRGSSAIYLTMDQYKEVTHLRVIVFNFWYIVNLSAISLQYICAGLCSVDGKLTRGL